MKVLIVGDLHAPFNHVNYLKFIKEQRDKLGADKIVFIGDLVDSHALSRYSSDPDGSSAGNEWKATMKELRKWYSAFPEAIWIIGNHDRRPFNKAYEHGIPSGMLKPLREIYQAPKGWKVVERAEIDNVLYIHGEGVGGLSTSLNSCLRYGQSVVFGHLHSLGAIKYHQQPTGQIFALATGCGVDDKSYAMAYGKYMPQRPILGCGIVTDGTYGAFVPMDLSTRKYRRKKRSIM